MISGRPVNAGQIIFFCQRTRRICTDFGPFVNEFLRELFWDLDASLRLQGHSDTVMYYWPSSRRAFIVGLFVPLPSLSQPNAHPFFAINFLRLLFVGVEIFTIYSILPDVHYRPLFVFCQILFERPCPLTAFEEDTGQTDVRCKSDPSSVADRESVWQTPRVP